jgi:hypothetical protein
MPSNWKCVQQFLKSSKREQIIRLPLAPVEKTRCLRHGIHIGSKKLGTLLIKSTFTLIAAFHSLGVGPRNI